MSDHIYKMVELVGSSETSIEDAIQTAIRRAGQTLRNLHWFEVVQTRGHIENGEVRHYQVVLKAGFTLEDEAPQYEHNTIICWTDVRRWLGDAEIHGKT